MDGGHAVLLGCRLRVHLTRVHSVCSYFSGIGQP